MRPLIKTIRFKTARNIFTNERVLILDAIKGGTNYVCWGCTGRMVPVIDHATPHFRHHTDDMHLHSDNCKYGEETQLHKLAKEYIQTLKEIKLKKIGTLSLEGKSILVERYLYYDDQFRLRISHAIPEGQSDVIKPDITIVDSKGVPILLVEIAVSHKLTNDKIKIIKYFGINTIELSIPKDIQQKEDIDKIQNSQNQTWIYHYEGYHIHKSNHPEHIDPTVYSDSEAESEQYEQERPIECTFVEINRLIRQFTKFMGSDDFNRVKDINESRIDSIKGRGAALEKNRRGIEARIEREVRIQIDDNEKGISREIRSIEQKYREIIAATEHEENELAGINATIEPEVRARFESKINGYEEQYNKQRSDLEQDTESIESRIGKVKNLQNKIQDRIGGFHSEYTFISNQEKSSGEQLQQGSKILQDEISNCRKIKKLFETVRNNQETLRELDTRSRKVRSKLSDAFESSISGRKKG